MKKIYALCHPIIVNRNDSIKVGHLGKWLQVYTSKLSKLVPSLIYTGSLEYELTLGVGC